MLACPFSISKSNLLFIKFQTKNSLPQNIPTKQCIYIIKTTKNYLIRRDHLKLKDICLWNNVYNVQFWWLEGWRNGLSYAAILTNRWAKLHWWTIYRAGNTFSQFSIIFVHWQCNLFRKSEPCILSRFARYLL